MANTNSLQNVIREYLEQVDVLNAPQANGDVKTILARAGFTEEEITQWLELFYTYTLTNISLKLKEEGMEEKIPDYAKFMRAKKDVEPEELNKLQTDEYEAIADIFRQTYEDCLKEFLATTFGVSI